MKLERIVKSAVLGIGIAAATVTAVNVAEYVDTRQKLDIEWKKNSSAVCPYQDVITGNVLTEKYSSRLKQGFNLLNIGEQMALREYADFCRQWDNVGMI